MALSGASATAGLPAAADVATTPRPKSCKRGGWHDRRPDCDNLLKAVMDALNGLIWTDDARIVDMRVQKDYAIGPPRVEISVEEVEAS